VIIEKVSLVRGLDGVMGGLGSKPQAIQSRRLDQEKRFPARTARFRRSGRRWPAAIGWASVAHDG
jgi:hypothetical protein